jgi:hypothetical protein
LVPIGAKFQGMGPVVWGRKGDRADYELGVIIGRHQIY